MKYNRNKFIVACLVLAAAMALSFGLPKPKYHGLNILAKLNVPHAAGDWQGKDVDQELNTNDARYNFIDKIFARTYKNDQGVVLTLFIFDAGNFHNPKICFNGAGFKVNDAPDNIINTANRRFKAHALTVARSGENYLLTYWITIDKKNVDWFAQKTQQLFASLFNRKKAGLMCRIDLPYPQGREKDATALVEDFLAALGKAMPSETADYIFGTSP